MTRRRALLPAVVAASVALVAGCAAEDAQAPAASATATVTVSPTPAEQSAAPSCETLILPSLAAKLAEQGWTAQTDAFRIGGTVVPNGLWCQWGDYSVASDHVQVYGWAPIDAATAATARQALLDQGWQAVGDSDVTENTASVFAADENGYGMTYRFGDGWVLVSDTMQGLLVIQRPSA